MNQENHFGEFYYLESSRKIFEISKIYFNRKNFLVRKLFCLIQDNKNFF